MKINEIIRFHEISCHSNLAKDTPKASRFAPFSLNFARYGSKDAIKSLSFRPYCCRIGQACETGCSPQLHHSWFKQIIKLWQLASSRPMGLPAACFLSLISLIFNSLVVEKLAGCFSPFNSQQAFILKDASLRLCCSNKLRSRWATRFAQTLGRIQYHRWNIDDFRLVCMPTFTVM